MNGEHRPVVGERGPGADAGAGGAAAGPNLPGSCVYAFVKSQLKMHTPPRQKVTAHLPSGIWPAAQEEARDPCSMASNCEKLEATQLLLRDMGG